MADLLSSSRWLGKKNLVHFFWLINFWTKYALGREWLNSSQNVTHALDIGRNVHAYFLLELELPAWKGISALHFLLLLTLVEKRQKIAWRANEVGNRHAEYTQEGKEKHTELERKTNAER